MEGDPQNPPEVPGCCGGLPSCDALEYCSQGWDLCKGCNGHGMVGGLRPDGYDMQECPFCNGTGQTTPSPTDKRKP